METCSLSSSILFSSREISSFILLAVPKSFRDIASSRDFFALRNSSFSSSTEGKNDRSFSLVPILVCNSDAN